MIKETDGDHFEAMRSLIQNLTFYATTEEFQLRNVEFDPQQMRSLKLIDSDGLYTNLALLLSDQCVHSIKAAVFQGKDQTIFKDRREFSWRSCRTGYRRRLGSEHEAESVGGDAVVVR